MTAFADLAHRHDFVLPLSRRLHDDVRDTLRADLLDPWRRPGVRAISQRALNLHQARLAEMRVSRPALDDQPADDEFMAAVLAALWHTAWVADQEGLELFIQILPVLAAADPDTAQAAAEILGFFADALSDGQRRDLDLLTQIRTAYPDRLRSGRGKTARRVQVTMPGLALRLPGPAAADPVIGDPADRQVAVMILQAQLWAGNGSDERAITSLRSAATRTSSTRLRQAIGTQASAIASRLIFAGPGNTAVPSAAGLAAAKIATETLTDTASAWNYYGAALYMAKRLGDALAAFDQGITLDPGNAAAHNGRGIALRALGRLGDALAAFDHAITLDPGNAITHSNRGIALGDLGRPGDALAAFDHAITLDPGNATPHNGRGNALQALGRLEDALAAYDQAITLEPGRAQPHENRGITLAMMGGLDEALAELAIAGHLAPNEAGEGTTWAGAILWHRRDAAGAQDRFASVAGRVTGCTPFRTAEMEAVALCGLGHAESAEQHLMAALPSWTKGDRADPRTIYDLLSDPPLPGIDRLRAITERDV
jgi:tetratricopeptide (TPR) repeat protein